MVYQREDLNSKPPMNSNGIFIDRMGAKIDFFNSIL